MTETVRRRSAILLGATLLAVFVGLVVRATRQYGGADANNPGADGRGPRAVGHELPWGVTSEQDVRQQADALASHASDAPSGVLVRRELENARRLHEGFREWDERTSPQRAAEVYGSPDYLPPERIEAIGLKSVVGRVVLVEGVRSLAAPGVRLQLEPEDHAKVSPYDKFGRSRYRSDAQGWFVCHYVCAGTWRLFVHEDRENKTDVHGSITFRIGPEHTGKDNVRVDLEVRRKPEITGLVRDGKTSRPVNGGWVGAKNVEWPHDDVSGEIDSEGRFRIQVVPGIYEIESRSGEYGNARIERLKVGPEGVAGLLLQGTADDAEPTDYERWMTGLVSFPAGHATRGWPPFLWIYESNPPLWGATRFSMLLNVREDGTAPFEIPVPVYPTLEGTYSILLSDGRYDLDAATISIPPATRRPAIVTIKATPSTSQATLAVEVRHESPHEHTKVILQRYPPEATLSLAKDHAWWPVLEEIQARAQADGSFVTDQLKPGVYKVVVVAREPPKEGQNGIGKEVTVHEVIRVSGPTDRLTVTLP